MCEAYALLTKGKLYLCGSQNKRQILFSSRKPIAPLKMKNSGIRSGKAKCYFHTAHTKGTLVLIKQGLDFEQKSVLCDPNGRFIILEAVAQGPEEICLSLEHQNPSKTSEIMGYFDRVDDRVTVSLHILYTANQETEGSQDRLTV